MGNQSLKLQWLGSQKINTVTMNGLAEFVSKAVNKIASFVCNNEEQCQLAAPYALNQVGIGNTIITYSPNAFKFKGWSRSSKPEF